VTLARPAAFLDRDGTINVRAPAHDYVRSADQFEWLPGAIEGMVRLGEAGWPLIVVSNQRGVSRGLLTEATLREIETRIQAALADRGCRVEAFRYCLHGIEEACECRKPRPGLLLAAAREMDLDLARSWMIGDSDDDVAAGRAAGCRTIRLGARPTDGAIVAGSLLEAAELVLANGAAS